MKYHIYQITYPKLLDRHPAWRSLDPTLDIWSNFMREKAFYLLLLKRRNFLWFISFYGLQKTHFLFIHIILLILPVIRPVIHPVIRPVIRPVICPVIRCLAICCPVIRYPDICCPVIRLVIHLVICPVIRLSARLSDASQSD